MGSVVHDFQYKMICHWGPTETRVYRGHRGPKTRDIQKDSASKARFDGYWPQNAVVIHDRDGCVVVERELRVTVHCMRAAKSIWYASRHRQILA